VTIFRKQTGLSLIEMVLVLTLSTAIILAGIRQYGIFKMDADAQLVQATVNGLFQGMNDYYQANCRTTMAAATSPIIIPIGTGATSLVTNGYLPIKWPPRINGLVDSTAGTDDGFSAQFNLQTAATRMPSGTFTNWEGTTPTPITVSYAANTPAVPVGTISVWVAQVTFKLATGMIAANYRGLLGADVCVSSLSGGTVIACSIAPIGGYIAWLRMPSFASPRTASPLLPTMMRIRGFTQLYTNDDMYGATNSTFESTNNYLCGG